MTKRKTNKGKKFRKIYPYVCKGCGKHRMAYDNDRAKGKTCVGCDLKFEYESTLPKLF